MKVFQVGLCKSNPMITSTEVFDFDNSECVYVYKNDKGQLTGDIFSDNKTSLDSTFVTVPNEGTYNYTFAIVSNVFKMATHHMVFDAGSDNSTNVKRYVSFSPLPPPLTPSTRVCICLPSATHMRLYLMTTGVEV